MANVLVGKTLTGIKVAKDQEALLFETTDGDVIVNADADCCSHTWIEHVELPALGFPAIVSAVEDLNLPDDYYKRHPGPPEEDSLALYGVKIVTDKGEILIDFRNESNGYYGGSLVWPGDYYYGGVFGQNKSDHEWTNL